MMGDSTRQLGHLDPRLRGKRTHICISCDFPIAVYGRCAPCLHAYCLTCAAEMSTCMICRSPITKLERIPGEAGLYISPATLQGFRTEADLAKHAQQLLGQIEQLGSMGGGPPLGHHQRQHQRSPGRHQQQQHQHHQQPRGRELPPPPMQQPQMQQPRQPGPPPMRPPPPSLGPGMGPGRPMPMPMQMQMQGGAHHMQGQFQGGGMMEGLGGGGAPGGGMGGGGMGPMGMGMGGMGEAGFMGGGGMGPRPMRF